MKDWKDVLFNRINKSNTMRKLNTTETLEISNAKSAEEMNAILSRYYLEVFYVVHFNNGEDSTKSYYLAETASDLNCLFADYVQRLVQT